jgi:hypothetical protein
VTGVLLRIGGTLVGVLLGFATGLWEVFLSPLYAGRVPVPIAPVLAFATNFVLVWFTHFITRHKGLALLPGIAWFAVMIISASKTSEGDLPIPGSDWMGLFAILLGALGWGIAAYRMILVTGADPVTAPPPSPPPATRAPADKPKPGARPKRSRT